MSIVAKSRATLCACVLFGCALDGDPTDTAAAGTAGDDGGSGDGTAGDETIGEGSTVTIYAIQQGKVPEMTSVRVENVVVTSPVSMEQGAVLVQDPMGGPWSGIYVYLYDEVVQGLPLAPGDIVSLTAEYVEYYDFSELTVKNLADIEVVGQGAVPAPMVVSAQDVLSTSATAEQYESVLVRIDDVAVTNPDLGHGDFEVESGVVVTNFFLFEQDQPIFPFAGATYDSVTGPLLYNFEAYKIAPRGPEDVPGAGGEPEGAVTIFAIQQGEVPVGAPVLVEDVVVTTPLTADGDTFWVEDPAGGQYSGISVFVADPQGLQVQPGDQVTITGTYDEFYDQSQIRAISATGIESTGTADVPPAEVVASSDIGSGESAEPWEGVLVQVVDAVVSMAANQFGEWEVDQALIVDDLFFDMQSSPAPQVQTAFASVTGALTYSFESYKLSPRADADLVPAR